MTVFFRLASRLPLVVLHWLGAAAGWLAWFASPAYRRHLIENSEQALGVQEARRLRSSIIAHAGKSVFELPRIWLRPLDEALALIRTVEGLDAIEQAQREGKGILYLTPHLGCFELTAQYLSRRAPLTVLYRPPKRAWLETLMQTGRTRPQLLAAAANLAGVRALMKALKRGEAVGILPDQTPKANEGQWLDFFGRPAYTMTLAARLTETGAAVVLIWAERLPGGQGFVLRLKSPAQTLHGNTEARAQQINREIEAIVRECPSQYLWGYNRYKQPAGVPEPPGSR